MKQFSSGRTPSPGRGRCVFVYNGMSLSQDGSMMSACRMSWIGSWVLLLVSSASQAAWRMNDVSFLFDFDDQTPSQALPVSPKSMGHGGELIPQKYLNRVGTLYEDPSCRECKKVRFTDHLALVAARIDPCAPLEDGEGCQPQIRLVWQPDVRVDTEHLRAGTVWRKPDAAVHSFYHLSKGQFASLAKLLSQNKAKYCRLSYSCSSGQRGADTLVPVSRFISRYDSRGSVQGKQFAPDVVAILLRWAGAATLSRVTFVRTVLKPFYDRNGWDYEHRSWDDVFNSSEDSSKVWFFEGFDVRDGRAVPISIPRVRGASQEFENIYYEEFNGFEGGPYSSPKFYKPRFPIVSSKKDALDPFLADLKQTVSDPAKNRAYSDVVNRVLNPTIHNVKTMDCATCHLASPALKLAGADSGDRALEFKPFAEIDRNRAESYQERNPNALRAFGYSLEDGSMKPAISVRTVFESAHVVDQMNARYPME